MSSTQRYEPPNPAGPRTAIFRGFFAFGINIVLSSRIRWKVGFICPSLILRRPHGPASEPSPVGQFRLRRGYETVRKAPTACATLRQSAIPIKSCDHFDTSLPIALVTHVYILFPPRFPL